MQPINIEKTFSTPLVKFTPENSTFLIEGRLIPEDATTVFNPINTWVDAYFAEGNSKLHIVFRLYYYNTSSSKRIVNLLKKMDVLFKEGKQVSIVWEYEEGDDDCMRDGQDYQALVKVPVEVVEAKELD
jgi:hypothetical protein